MPYRPTIKNSDGTLTDLPLEAETAVKLKTARSISLSGVTATAQSFNGSSNITIPITAVPGTLLTGSTSISTTGNAGTATKLATARTIGLSGVTATAQSFNGSANITIPITAVPANLITGNVHAYTAERAVYDTNTLAYSQLQINANGYILNGNKTVSSKEPLYLGTIGTSSTDYTILSGDNFPTPGCRYEVVYMDNNCKKSFEILFPSQGSYSYVYLCFSLMFGVTTSDYDVKIKTSSAETYKYIYWKIDHTNQKVMQTKYAAGTCAATTAYFKGIYKINEPMGAV